MSEMQNVFVYSDDVIMTESGQMKVLMSMNTGDFIELNSTGRAIWDLVDGERTLAEIAEILQENYSDPASQCEEDLKTFVAGLQSAKLLRQVS